MDPFAKPTPLFWWQTTPCNTKEHCSQILETVRILPFAKHITGVVCHRNQERGQYLRTNPLHPVKRYTH